MMEQEPILNAHNKSEYEPAHTAEHILNQTMVRMFGCPRSRNAHVERKKSKLNYELAVANSKLTQAQTNLKNAEENLSMAQESFAAGVISSSDLMAAQTAWLSASSELLDAGIEVQMDYLYLNQALGR